MTKLVLPGKGETLAKCFSVIALVAQGITPTRACDQSQIAWSTFTRACGDNTELLDMYKEAVERGYDVLADILLEIDSNPIYGSMNPAMAKVISDNIKWYLSKKRPDTFGDKVTINHNVTADKAITDALQAARERSVRAIAYEPSPSTVIDLEPVKDDPFAQFR